MKITAWHDNTAANKANPDPNVWVGYGDRTVDEMAHAWVNVTYLTDEDYLEEVGARRRAVGEQTGAIGCDDDRGAVVKAVCAGGDRRRECGDRVAHRDGRNCRAPPLVLEPIGARGEAIFPAFEGWGPDKNGENVLLLGYYNRNKSQELVIPIGPDNRIEPDGPDYGQPTHFYPGRQHGVFAIKVPKDFGNEEADVDADGQRPDLDDLVLAEPGVLGELLQASRQQQRAAPR